MLLKGLLCRIVVLHWGVPDIKGMRVRDAAQHTIVQDGPPQRVTCPDSVVPEGGAVPRPVLLRLFKSVTH